MLSFWVVVVVCVMGVRGDLREEFVLVFVLCGLSFVCVCVYSLWVVFCFGLVLGFGFVLRGVFEFCFLFSSFI